VRFILSHCSLTLSSPARVAALLVMRVYALYYRNKWILSVVMLEVVAGTLVACVSAALGTQRYLHVNSCSGVSHEYCIERATKIRHRDSESPHPPAFQDPAPEPYSFTSSVVAMSHSFHEVVKCAYATFCQRSLWLWPSWVS
jgi:hypothetical protein